MLRVLSIPDSFKGSLSASQIVSTQRNVFEGFAQYQFHGIPFSDGGEGFISAFGDHVNIETVNAIDPLARPIKKPIAWIDAKTAVIEVAQCSGLHLVEELDPWAINTYGTGLQIRYAIEQGAERIILGLGGSATIDLGIGILSALGVGFEDQKKWPVTLPMDFKNAVNINTAKQLDTHCEFIIASDVENPLFGNDGAVNRFGPQKGLQNKDFPEYDAALMHLCKLIEKHTNTSIDSFAGAGAAGGIAAGLSAFYNIKVVPGFNYLADSIRLEEQIQSADIIITGEGKVDSSTLNGKLVNRIVQLGEKHKKPIVIFCGQNTIDYDDLYHIIPLYEPDQRFSLDAETNQQLLAEKTRTFIKETLAQLL